MKTRVNSLTSIFAIATFFASVFVTNTVSAAGLSLFDYNVGNKVVPNCYLQKEYNYFMNQWTTNEVCNPSVKEVQKNTIPSNNSGQYVVGNSQGNNIYLGNTTANNNAGYYTGNNSVGTVNTWNGYGSATNYLLGNWGGGINSNSYYNNYPGFVNSLYYYTPSVSKSWYSDWYGNSDYGYYDSYNDRTSSNYSYDDTYSYSKGYDEYGKIGTEDHAWNYGVDAGLAGYSPSEAVQNYNDDYGTDY